MCYNKLMKIPLRKFIHLVNVKMQLKKMKNNLLKNKIQKKQTEIQKQILLRN